MEIGYSDRNDFGNDGESDKVLFTIDDLETGIFGRVRTQ